MNNDLVSYHQDAFQLMAVNDLNEAFFSHDETTTSTSTTKELSSNRDGGREKVQQRQALHTHATPSDQGKVRTDNVVSESVPITKEKATTQIKSPQTRRFPLSIIIQNTSATKSVSPENTTAQIQDTVPRIWVKSSSPNQIVQFLLNLARKSTPDLRRALYDDDVFQLKELEHQCPFAFDVIPWLPPTLTKTAKSFREKKNGVILWYEHLSKAGGTSFCTLANANMPKQEVPRYYCMPPDSENIWRKDGRVGRWSNEKLAAYLANSTHRIVSNEWEPFPPARMKYPREKLLLVTTIRDPLDRLLSAYRFFAKNVTTTPLSKWLVSQHAKSRRKSPIDGVAAVHIGRYNFITWKFSNGTMPLGPKSKARNLPPPGLNAKYASQWLAPFRMAVQTLAKFDLVLLTQEMSTHPEPIRSVLGWTNLNHTHVVPSKTVMNSNAASELTKLEYSILWNANRFDMILYHWMQAVYMARLQCADAIDTRLPFIKYSDPPPRPYPYAGALDELQNWGYRHDPTVLRQNPPSFQVQDGEREQICALPGLGPEGASGYELVTKKVKVAPKAVSKEPKVFCAVHTNHGNFNRTKAIAETWGQHCDGYMSSSTFTHRPTGTVHIPHRGQEGKYGTIWQKVRSMLVYLYDNFLDEYDYFHICGDDTFLIVENLKYFLSSARVVNDTASGTLPLFAGGWIRPFWKMKKILYQDFYYNGGGPGYTLNRAALTKIVEEGLPQCSPDAEVSYEDLNIGLCFWQLGIRPYDTRDGLQEHRYHHLDPEMLVKRGRLGGLNDKYWDAQLRWFKREHGWERKEGLQVASRETVAFHLIGTSAHMRRLYMLMYMQNETVCPQDDSLRQVVA